MIKISSKENKIQLALAFHFSMLFLKIKNLLFKNPFKAFLYIAFIFLLWMGPIVLVLFLLLKDISHWEINGDIISLQKISKKKENFNISEIKKIDLSPKKDNYQEFKNGSNLKVNSLDNYKFKLVTLSLQKFWESEKDFQFVTHEDSEAMKKIEQLK